MYYIRHLCLFYSDGDHDHCDSLLTPNLYYDRVLCIMYYIRYLCLFHSDGWVKGPTIVFHYSHKTWPMIGSYVSCIITGIYVYFILMGGWPWPQWFTLDTLPRVLCIMYYIRYFCLFHSDRWVEGPTKCFTIDPTYDRVLCIVYYIRHLWLIYSDGWVKGPTIVVHYSHVLWMNYNC